MVRSVNIQNTRNKNIKVKFSPTSIHGSCTTNIKYLYMLPSIVMLRTYAEDLESDAFNAEEYVERLAWRLTGPGGGDKIDAVFLNAALEEEISNLQILFDQCQGKIRNLENQCREEEETFCAALEKLVSENEIADGKLKTLNERVNSVAARVVHLGDQLQSVTAPRARAFEAYQLMVHFNEFLSDQPLESETFTDPDKLVEAGEVIYKLHIIAMELPKEKYEAVQTRIAYKYDELEKMLIEEFVRHHHANAKLKMKQIANVLSQFNGYSQAIDAYVEQCQWVNVTFHVLCLQSFRGGDIFTDIWNMLQKHDPVINDVFPNPQQVMSKLVLNIYHGKLQGYVRSKLLNASDPELYLSSLYDLFQKNNKLVDKMTSELVCCPEKDFILMLVNTVFSKYLPDYIKIETNYLHDQCKSILQKFYEKNGHVKKSGFSGIQDLKRDLQARLMQDTRTNYSLLSEEVAINILQETKLAFHRCGVLSSANDLSENVRQILDILMQYLCREHLEYAVDLAVNAIQSNENQGVKDFLNILRQTAAISHLLEKQIDDSVSALLKNSSQSTSCLEHAKSLLETIEAKLDKGVDKMLTTIVGHVRFILTTEQKKQEFKPEEDDNNSGEIPLCSNACSMACKYLSQQIAIMNESLDGSNLENTLTELVVRFHRVIVDHIYQFQYNSQGAMLLLCDVSEYRKVVSELNIPIAKKLFVTLHALCNLLIVSSDHLLSACSSNTLPTELYYMFVLEENFDKSILMNFVQLRADCKASRLLNLFQT
ncbi:Exocyst complex component 5 [Trichinella sp. T8]|nr:Exocyst complex component 5 [Trichinella sp. T8]